MRKRLVFFWILTLAVAFGAGHYGDHWTQQELPPATSFREAFDQGDPLIRPYLLNGYLQTLNPENLAEALATVAVEQRWMTRSELQGFMLAWVRFDAPGALDWALSRPAAQRDAASAAAIYAYAFRNPADALAALDSLENGNTQEILREPFVKGWIDGDHIDGVADYIAAMPTGNPQQRLADTYARRLIRQSPEAVMQWADGISDQGDHRFKITALDAASYALASANPRQAADWVEGQLDQPYSAKAPSSIALVWFDHDHAAALHWLMGLESVKVRDEMFQLLFKRWADEDLNEAAAWLLTVSPGPRSDWAIQSLIRRHIAKDLSIALRWASRISDLPLRQRVLISLGRKWARRDPTELEAFLAESTFPDWLQQAMTNELKRDEPSVDDHSEKAPPHAAAEESIEIDP